MNSITTEHTNGMPVQPADFRDGILSEDYKVKIEPQKPTPHKEILERLKDKIKPVNFRKKAELGEDEKLLKKHFVVLVIDELLELAEENDWGICKRHDFIYLYNGAYWSQLDEKDLKKFLNEAALEMGVDKYDADYFRFGDDLLKQFHYKAYLPKPETDDNSVLINLENGTVEINPEATEKINVRRPKRSDFITYQLPFKYNQQATASRFRRYLNEVLPDEELQKILAECMGSVFIKTSTLKLEKALILHGAGSNGKSVFFDIVNALLGNENVSTYTLESLTNNNGYYRAKIANKLVNYASEINGNMETGKFKQLVSGEPIEARLPYGNPFTIRDYAKLIFNANELPHDVEHTHAFFRRFMIIPFEVTIPEEKQDKELSKKIIDNELSGVFNWVLDGLKRVLKQKGFTKSDVVEERNERYRKETDNVQMFIEEKGYSKDVSDYTALKELYAKYRSFCEADGYYPTAKKKFSKRLENAGFKKVKKPEGMAFHITKDEI